MMRIRLIDKKTIGFVIFSLVNVLFSVKYFSRMTDFYPVLAAAVLFIHFLLFYKGAILKRFAGNFTALNVVLLLVFFIFCFFVFRRVPVETLNVDRWSIITSFWDNYFNGEYVYYAQSHMHNNHPGGMPFYFILALPFYLLGETGYYAALGIIVFYLTMRYARVEAYMQTLFLLLIMTSPFFLYEITVRSPLFLNASLIAFSMYVFFHIRDYRVLKNQMIAGVITGLLLSTRHVFAPCYLVLFLYFLKTRKTDLISTVRIGLLTVLVFGLTFIPFTVGHFNDFLKINPFVIQSSTLMPFSWVLVATAGSCMLFLFCKKDSDVFFYSGTVLFIIITTYFAWQIVHNSLETAYCGSSADVAYFIFCVPFFLCHACDGQRRPRSDNPESYKVLTIKKQT
jgi:hypothetical protein